ncbi:FecCD family ABC transporter permease [Marinagarivorans cellulosilyticus]|uniref:Iron complex transport system permease protein n=1 Tax=Marinagarivorans cellulosilyticus TaxID=2721545 RepID=A0AAN2BLE1_9GAMM|nr:iron ABC transporter permease [Marinagarivorans cellulosilyticus]BCD99048.1 iron complex transport system permease protein [Marinagarivorans cellulosilyticus]
MLSPVSVRRYWPLLLASCLLLLAVLVLLALAIGAVPIAPYKLLLWLQGEADLQTKLIVESLRLPRALLAICLGALLAVCGAAAQGLFRNPLADPSLIGVSGGASAGASIVIVLLNFSQWGWLGLSLVSLGAFTGAVLVVLCVYRLATNAMGTSVATMLLAGVAFSYLAGGLANGLEFVADNHKLRQISLWQMGGLESADAIQVVLAFSVFCVVFYILYRLRSALNALLLGESEARHLGVDVARVKRRVIVCIAAGVGVSVALAGVISFIGLIVPHIVRMVLGPNHRYLLPVSACVGAMLLVVADLCARTFIAPTELPIGLLTTALGAPVFIMLLRSRFRYGEAV